MKSKSREQLKKTAREKLVEKDIDWGQVYTDKTQFLKDQYNDIIGVGSYFRFEGTASDGDSYYCIIGPAKVHKPRAKWFAGVRKLPATYSAGGKYFDSMDGAAKYAKETWGVPTPQELKPYTSSQLYGISEKIHKWKAEREEAEENKENKEDNKDNLENKSFNRSLLMTSFNLARFNKEAMGYVRQENRPVYSWFDVTDNLESDSDWASLTMSTPSLSSILREAKNKHRESEFEIAQRYGLTLPQINKCLKTYVGYEVNFGGYILSVGPYTGEKLRDAWDKFGYFILRKRYETEEAMQKTVAGHVQKYMENYGVQLEPSDFKFIGKSLEEEGEGAGRGSHLSRYEFNVDPNDPAYENFYAQNRMVGAGSGYQLSPSGQVKLMRNNWGTLYNQAVTELASTRGITPEEAEIVVANDPNFVNSVFKTIKNKYDEAVLSGDAAITGMIPPPANYSKFKNVGLGGAQIYTTIKGKQQSLLKKLRLNDQVLQLMISGTTNPQDILGIVNSSRKENKQVTLSEVQSLVQNYTARASEENKDLPQVYADLRENINNLQAQQIGMTDLKTAFDTAKAALGHDKIRLDANFPNVTEDDIKEIRLAYEYARQHGEPWPPEGGITPVAPEAQDVEGELEMEVGEASPTSAPEQTPTGDEVAPVAPAVEEEEEEILMPTNMMNMFGGTMNSLMKISTELRLDGKIAASEEINKIIKKYQKGK